MTGAVISLLFGIMIGTTAGTIVTIIKNAIKEKSLAKAVTFGAIAALAIGLVCAIPVGAAIRVNGGIFTEREAEAKIIATGYKGVTVECASEFGKDRDARFQVVTEKDYAVGDDVIIIIKDSIFSEDPDISIKAVKTSENGG